MFARLNPFALAALVVGLASHAAYAADDGVVQKIGHGEINWSTKFVTATGSGAANLKDGPVAVARLNAERAAKLDALRNILETLKGVQVDGKRNVGDLMSNGTIKSRVEGLARGFRVVDTRYYDDGSVDMIITMPIDDSLTQALNLEPKKRRQVSNKGAVEASSLIVNAKGLGAVPSIAPRVVDEKGAEVYGASVVSEDGLKQGGIASYTSDVASAKSHANAGAQPMTVKGLRLAKGTKSDIVISNADADKLRDKNKNLSFLSAAKVIIVVD